MTNNWKRGSVCLLLALQAFLPSWADTPLSAPLEEAQRSLLRLRTWKFQPDARDEGVKGGWAEPTFDDRGWRQMDPYKPWQEQGFPDHHGIGWYRMHIDVPDAWKGSKVLFHSEGIKEEYDL